MKLIISWLPLIGVIIAGSFAIAQIRLNNITNSRIKWLDGLKALIADFNSEVFRLSLNKSVVKRIDSLKEQGYSSNLADDFASTVNNGLVKQLKVIQYKFYMIRLNLNPKEDLHIALTEVIDYLMDLINQIPKTTNEQHPELVEKMTACSDRIVLIARLIFKLEWEKLKRNWLFRKLYLNFGAGESIRKEILELAQEASSYHKEKGLH